MFCVILVDNVWFSLPLDIKAHFTIILRVFRRFVLLLFFLLTKNYFHPADKFQLWLKHENICFIIIFSNLITCDISSLYKYDERCRAYWLIYQNPRSHILPLPLMNVLNCKKCNGLTDLMIYIYLMLIIVKLEMILTVWI